MNTQYRKNLKDVATACKNYTDTQIVKTKEEIYWHIGEYSVTTSNDNTSASVKTVPSNATRCKIKRVYGNSVKYAPSTASDDTTAKDKSIPSNTYSVNVDSVGGMSYKYNQFLREINSTNWVVSDNDKGSVSFNGNETIYTNTVVATGYTMGIKTVNYISTSDLPNGHKCIVILKAKASEVNNDTKIGFDILNRAGDFSNNLTTSYQQFAEFFVSKENNPTFICYRNNPVLNANLYIRDVVLADLTAIFGSGNEPADVASAISLLQTRGYKLDGTDEYNVGTIRDTVTTAVKFTGTGQTDIIKQIPAEIQALDGYGWGVNDTCYNYIDFENKKFIQKVARVDLGTLSWTYNSATKRFETTSLNTVLKVIPTSTTVANLLCSIYDTISGQTQYDDLTLDMTISQGTTDYPTIRVRNLAYTDATAFKTAMSGVYLYYELATPVETDISTYLTDFNPIETNNNYTDVEFVNQYNADMPNKVSFYGTIKETLCTAIEQRRNGTLIKTIQLPYETSDGWSAGSVANVRDFTNNTRTPYVDKVDLGTLDYYYVSDSAYPYFICYDISSVINKPADNYTKANILSVLENQRAVDIRNNGYLGVAIDNNGYIRIATSTMGTDATVFKNAMSGTYLYYEQATSTSSSITAIENVIEVEAGDTLTFVNENNQAVPSDLTYRIEVAN